MKYTDVLHKKADTQSEMRAEAERKYFDKLRKSEKGKQLLSRVSPIEILGMAAGGAVGGTAGYLLSKLIHKDPSTLTKLLYTLGGAVAGSYGGYKLGDIDVVINEGEEDPKKQIKLPAREAFRLKHGIESDPELKKSYDKHTDYGKYMEEGWSSPSAIIGASAGTARGALAGGILAVINDRYNKLMQNRVENQQLQNAVEVQKAQIAKNTGSNVPVILDSTGRPASTPPKTPVLTQVRKPMKRSVKGPLLGLTGLGAVEGYLAGVLVPYFYNKRLQDSKGGLPHF